MAFGVENLRGDIIVTICTFLPPSATFGTIPLVCKDWKVIYNAAKKTLIRHYFENILPLYRQAINAETLTIGELKRCLSARILFRLLYDGNQVADLNAFNGDDWKNILLPTVCQRSFGKLYHSWERSFYSPWFGNATAFRRICEFPGETVAMLSSEYVKNNQHLIALQLKFANGALETPVGRQKNNAELSPYDGCPYNYMFKNGSCLYVNDIVNSADILQNFGNDISIQEKGGKITKGKNDNVVDDARMKPVTTIIFVVDPIFLASCQPSFFDSLDVNILLLLNVPDSPPTPETERRLSSLLGHATQYNILTDEEASYVVNRNMAAMFANQLKARNRRKLLYLKLNEGAYPNLDIDDISLSRFSSKQEEEEGIRCAGKVFDILRDEYGFISIYEFLANIRK